jgi:hypothetical protein
VTYVDHGRCRSGQRWFWYAAVLDYDYPRCDDPVCEPGLHLHEHGWEDTEDLALKAMSEAVSRLGGEVRCGSYKGNAPGRESAARNALKRINAARRRARPPEPGANGAVRVEYLYEPWSWYDDDSVTHKGINEIPVMKKTAKRIYYDNTDRWDRSAGVVTLGYIDRQEFENDTRCRDRERDRRRREREPELKRLRREMAAVHPDRGGTDAEFIAARKRYERALREAS